MFFFFFKKIQVIIKMIFSYCAFQSNFNAFFIWNRHLIKSFIIVFTLSWIF